MNSAIAPNTAEKLALFVDRLRAHFMQGGKDLCVTSPSSSHEVPASSSVSPNTSRRTSAEHTSPNTSHEVVSCSSAGDEVVKIGEEVEVTGEEEEEEEDAEVK